MIAGATLFAEAYPYLKRTVLTWGDYGKITLPEALGIGHWPLIALFVLCGLAVCGWIEKKHM
jgi:hypothetical protein